MEMEMASYLSAVVSLIAIFFYHIIELLIDVQFQRVQLGCWSVLLL